MKIQEYRQISMVTVKGERIPLDDCEFLNVEEDMSGRDLVTFKYQDVEYQSFVTLGYR
jgi:hypothetical protein